MASISGERDIGEQRHLVPALGDALRQLVGAAEVSTGRRLQTRDRLPDWDPLPGPVDVVIGEPPSPLARLLVGLEVKSRTHRRKLGETPYDIFKMASLRRMEGVDATYIVVAATRAAFNSNEPGAELFNTPVGTSEEWYSSYFIKEWFGAWAQLLGDSSGKPLRVPRTLWLHLV